MNELETRLPQMLTGAADRLGVHPDLEDATNLHRARFVTGEEQADSPRRLLLVGVAAAVVLLVGGLVVVSSRNTVGPAGSADSPATVGEQMLFPVVDDVPTWAGDLYGSYRIPDALPAPRQVWAVLGRPDGAGGFSDQIVVLAQAERSEEDRTGFEELDVDGRTVFIRRSDGAPEHVEMVLSPDASDPFVSVNGSVHESLLARVLAGVSVSGAGGEFDLTIGDIPDGYGLMVAPVALRTPVISAAASSDGNALDVAVDSSWPDPRLRAAIFSGDVTAVQMGNSTAWYSQAIGAPEGTFTIAWSPAPGITLVADVSNPRLTAEEAISIAGSVRLTNEDEWRNTLGVEDNPLPESPALVVGQPVPAPDECDTTVVTIDSKECD